MGIVNKIKGFLLEPSKTFDDAKKDTLGEAITYYAIILIVYAILIGILFGIFMGIMSTLMGPELGAMIALIGLGGGAIGLVVAIFVIIGGIIAALIGGVILHIFVYIAGGRKGLTQTIKALLYGSTPSLVLGWIPLINIFALIWSVILEIIGIRQLHEITTARAVLAVLLPVIIIAIIVVIAIVAALSFGGGVPRTYY